MDIRAFIAARLNEREAAAKRAIETSGGEIWRASDSGLYPEDNPSQHPGPFLADVYGFTDSGYGDHIAGHDPAWVLRDVAAKRAILAGHPPLPDYTEAELHAYGMHPEWEYATTEGQRKAWDYADVPPDGGGWERLDFTEESYWRRRLPPDQARWRSEPRELRLLAAIDEGHPDFNPAWKLDES